MMKEKDYRKEIGERIEEAYLSMPIGDPPSREKFDKWIAIAEQRRRERIRRRKKMVSCAAVMLICVCLGVACIVKPPQVAAGGKGGGEVNSLLATSDKYESQDSLPEEIKEEFLLFPELPQGYEEVEAIVEKDGSVKMLSLQCKNQEGDELYVNEVSSKEEDKLLNVLDSGAEKETIGETDVYINRYTDGAEETTYTFIHEEVLVIVNAPNKLDKNTILSLIEKAVHYRQP